MSALIDLGIGLTGAGLLWATFRALQVRWPESYFAIEDLLSQRVSVSPLRYGFFRFVPILLISGFAAVTSRRAGGYPWFAALTVAVVHAWVTAGRATVAVVRRSGLFARRLLVAYHVLLAAGIMLVGVVGALIGLTDWFPAVVPSIPELRSDLWTAMFAAALGAYFVRVTQGRQPSVEDLVRYSRENLGAELVALTREVASAESADEDLAEAILLVENLQRPKWIRYLERGLGRILKFGTYGVMQVRSKAPISDEESIRLAVTQHLSGKPIPMTQYGPDQDALLRTIRFYNSNPRFVELVRDVYHVVRSETRSGP